MSGPVATKASQDKSAEQAGGRSTEQVRPPKLSSPHADVLALQDAAGNRAVNQLLQSATNNASTPMRAGLLQRKCACDGTPGLDNECAECHRKRLAGQTRPLIQTEFRISQTGDKYEQEADRVADMVMRMPQPVEQHPVEPSGDELIQMKPLPAQITPVIQRQIKPDGPLSAPPIVHEVLRSPGQPLDTETRAFMESRFGHDFSPVRVHAVAPQSPQTSLTVNQPGDRYEQEADRVAKRVVHMEGSPGSSKIKRHNFSKVRVHTDAKAAKSAQAMNALAYTVGHKIVFGAGQYMPTTAVGRRLLAHELAHVVQQQRLAGPRLQMSRLRDYRESAFADLSIADLESTNEYKAYMDPRLIWQWQLGVTKDEALLACALMLQAIQQGEEIDWKTRAREFVLKARSLLSFGREVSRLLEERTTTVTSLLRTLLSLKPREPAPTTPSRPREEAETEPIAPVSPEIEQLPEPDFRLSPEEEAICGKLSKVSGVIKGSGRMPDFEDSGFEWEVRVVQQGQCCSTFIFRLKQTFQPERLVYGRFKFDGKTRVDGRWTHNTCTGRHFRSARLSWEGKLRIGGITALERRLKERGWSGGGMEFVLKPQIAGELEPPQKPSNLFRVTFLLLIRGGFEVTAPSSIREGADPKTIFEVRYHPFECELGWVEFWGRVERGRFAVKEWDIKILECLSRLRRHLMMAIPKAEPRFRGPWYERSEDLGKRQW